MTRYLLRVYSDASYHPDRGMHSISRRRLERWASALERDGFATKILQLPAPTAPRRPR
jgi:hypothetical protein